MSDLRFALRLLWKEKGFTATAAATLAVCIGANVALFTVVHNVLLRPLGVPESNQVLLLYNSYPKAGVDRAGATAPDYVDRLRDMTVFESQAMFNTRDPSLGNDPAPERIHVMQVTPSFFRLVRVAPRLGRAFNDEEGEIGRTHEIILSEGLRRRRFGASNAIGQTLRIDGEPYTVIGAMPPDFIFIDSRVEAWVPLAFTAEQKTERYSNSWSYIGRLKPGATLAQAQAQVDAIGAANLERYPESRQILTPIGFHVVATRLQDTLVRDVKPTLYLLWGGALFVLLIGCVNVASLALVRSRTRLKELAMRIALGATRWRVARQLTIEYLTLTLLSAAAGLALGAAAIRLLGTLNLENLPRAAEIHVDGAVVGYTAAAACVIAVLLAVLPLVAGATADLNAVLRQEGRSGSAGRGLQSLRRALVVTQVAVAFVLLVGAGLLFASFRHVLAIDPGFVPDAVLTASVNLPPARYAKLDDAGRFTDDALRAVRAIPGVTVAGVTTMIPFGSGFNEDVIFPEGFQKTSAASLVAAYHSWVSPGYFETMRIPLKSGRYFDERDGPNAAKVMIVDERMAQYFWPGMDPVGRRMFEPSDRSDPFAITPETRWYTVVGVVGAIRFAEIVESSPLGAYYMPIAQRAFGPGQRTFAIRIAGNAAAVLAAARREAARIDPELPVYDVQTMPERLDKALVTKRTPVWLAIAFAAVAVFLSAIGVYGVLAYLVTQRTKEIGIRVALGSTATGVFQLVVREGVVLAGFGLLIGVAGTVALARVLSSQLVGIGPGDPLVIALAIVLLAIVAFTASALPAGRASRIDPVIALSD